MLCKIIVASTILSTLVSANMAPSYPEPGTIWKTGQEYQITWFNDKKSPSIEKGWRNFKIDFMTGDNNRQKFLKNVAENLDGRTVKTFNWTAPEVEPNAAVYFFMFTNEKGEHAWTTRFGIAGADGKLVKPEHATQPDGANIPWGVGKLVTKDSATGQTVTAGTSPSSTYSMSPAMSSAAEKNASLEIAVSSDANMLTASTLVFLLCYAFFSYMHY
jgi:hypothetical protein